jgi:DNA-directed RNA polymerase specialized sigma24 family protein
LARKICAKRKIMKKPSKKTAPHDQIRALTIEQLNQLTAADLNRLAAFAERRMGRLPRSRVAGEDAVQKALLSIIRGIGKGKSGRRPRQENLRTKDAFLHYIRSATNSVIEGAQRNRELLFIHQSVHRTWDGEEEETTAVLAAGTEPDADASLVDLKHEFFLRLRRKASSKLLPDINEWEQTFFWADHVPYYKDRDHSRQLRVLAKRVLKDLAEDLGI